MHSISVIIVSWNAQGYLRDCLQSIRQTGGKTVSEVIVVDNASTDGSPEMVAREFPEVTLIRSNENLGFARANNLGLRHATGSLVALINSDVIVRAGCFDELAALFDSDERAGLAGPKVFGGDGVLQYTCGKLPTVWNTTCRLLALDRVLARWPLFSGLQMRHWDYAKRAQVEVLSGCFWLARRKAIDEVGGLDERFFFYAEDVDWCKRFKDAGWKIFFVPEATTTHFGGGSSANAPLRYSIEMLRGSLIYWNKHHGLFGKSTYYLLALTRHGFRIVAYPALRISRLSNAGEINRRLKEDLVCLRWLLTGKGV